VIRRAETFAHVQTLLHLAWANARVCDPSNASFTGFYHTTAMGGWSDELLAACDTDSSRMPRVLDANHVAGHISDQGASRFHLRQGTPVLVGCMDTSAAMLMGSSSGSVASGQLINVAGTTDVLGLAVDECRVDERVLTRALGVGRKWMSVATIATAGAAIEWALRELFPEDVDRNAVLNQLDFSRPLPEVDINFAGSRTSIEQTFGEIRGVKLSTTRHDILAGIVIALARAGSRRFELLRQINPVDFSPTVLVSGGYATDMGDAIDQVLYKDWPVDLTRLHVDHATLRGLGMLAAAADL